MIRVLAIHEVGDRTGAPVLYLHGSGSSRLEADLYDQTAARLGIRLIAWDRPGSGQSPGYPGRVITDVVADARQALEQSGVDRAAAVGLSGGGTHVLALAALGDNVISRAVAINPGGPATPEALKALPLKMRLLVDSARRRPWLFQQLAKPMERMGADLEATLSSRLKTRAMDETDLAMLRSPHVLGPFARATTEGSRQPGAWRTEAELFWARDWDFDPFASAVPLHVFSGQDDPYRSFALALAAHGAQLHTFPGGHVSGFATTVMQDVLHTAIST